MNSLVDAAHAAGKKFTSTLSREEQRALGQFMTPPAIARFMAQSLVTGIEQKTAKILEPAAGGGILAAATIEALLAKPAGERPTRIELLMYELDARLIPCLRQLTVHMKEICAQRDVEFDCVIRAEDFLLSDLAQLGEPLPGLLTISNPPFLKLNKAKDERASRHSYAVHGQPNIYALFMAATARLTPSDGAWCFITPRSWMAGAYFKATRRTLLRHLRIDRLHAFESRTEGFEEDSVLQETVITWAKGRANIENGTDILVTRSRGANDLSGSGIQRIAVERVVGDDDHAMFSLPADNENNPFQAWSATFKTYGLEVSTGPVVAFRAQSQIRETADENTAPLLWLQHIKQQQINWPINKKREHIVESAESLWMLVRNAPMVIMRRFSPKEDERRVTCAAYLGNLPGETLGLENHLNYIYRRNGAMTTDEARGISAFLASQLVDAHFRSIAGSTQINATELRNLRLPPLNVLIRIGELVGNNPCLQTVDRIVASVIANETMANLPEMYTR